MAKNSFKIALNSSEAQPAWSLHATWVNNATEHKPALSVEQQLGPGAPIRARNVRCKTRNQILRPRTPHPNDKFGQLHWHVASQYLATDLHDVHRVDLTLPSMREGPNFKRALPSFKRRLKAPSNRATSKHFVLAKLTG